jgi:hypothetical protein
MIWKIAVTVLFSYLLVGTSYGTLATDQSI